LANQLFDLNGLTALITGSSRGIGKACALRMAEQGARVVVSGRRAETCAAAASEIEAATQAGQAIAVPANVTRREELAALVARATSAFGGIDILVCNAAIHPYVGPAMGTSDDVMRKILDANLMSAHWLCQMVLPGMVERGFGRIVFVASIAGLQGSSKFYSYSITKAAEMQMARALAVEYGARNIRVNVIAPGTVDTDMAAPYKANPAMMESEMRRNTVKRLGLPDEIAGVAVMLAAPAGAYINGQVIAVDGGYSINFDLCREPSRFPADGSRPRFQDFFSSGHSLWATGLKAFSPGTVPTIL
jgi:NAD(P)-dependent dehydrogenase (short-subunit alcohol dehydrogenase family)